jgi:sn-glycerol 3-phosphate transport system permease protein
MEKRVTFTNVLVPYLLVAAQLAVTLVFFIWPAGQALFQSVISEDAFGLARHFIWFDNFKQLFGDPLYLGSVETTFIFSAAVAGISMAAGLLLAAASNRVLRGAASYKLLLVWPYALAPAIAGVLWLLLFNPTVGIVAYALHRLGYGWNYLLNGNDAMVLIIVAAAWKQVSYNFLFFLAGLQAIPHSLIEAAAIDGARPLKRFWTIVFPLLSPTSFFLLVVNLVYAFFDTFGIVHATTMGGPAQATEILVYEVYRDGFIGLDLGGSAAQSVVLMVIVGLLTVVQFRFIERKVVY